MKDGTRLPVVAIINTTPDAVDMLRLTFEAKGYVVISTFTHMIRDGLIDIEAFGRLHQPDVILYDIAPPYRSNWQLFQHVRRLPVFQGRPFIVTSTNPGRVRAFAGEEQQIFEVVETPYELMSLVDKVQALVGAPQ